MPENVATLDVRLNDQTSAGAKAATDALNKLAGAADGASKSTDEFEKTTTRVGKSSESVYRSLNEQSKITADLTRINGQYIQQLEALRAAYATGDKSLEELNLAETRLAQKREQAITQSRRQADAMTAYFDELRGAGASFDQLNQRLSVSAQLQAALTSANKAYSDQLSVLRTGYAATGQSATQLSEAEKQLGIERDQAIDAANRHADATKRERTELETQSGEVDKLMRTLSDSYRITQDVAAVNDKYAASLDLLRSRYGQLGPELESLSSLEAKVAAQRDAQVASINGEAEAQRELSAQQKVTQEVLVASVRSAEQEYDKLLGSLSATYKLSQDVAAINQSHAESVDLLRNSYGQLGPEIESLSALEAKLSAQRDAQVASINGEAEAQAQLLAQQKQAEAELQALTDRLGGYTSATSAADQITQKYASDLSMLRQAAANNKMSSDQLTENEKSLRTERDQNMQQLNNGYIPALQRTGKAIDDTGISSKQTAFAVNQMRVQSTQMISGLLTGQPVLATLIQQIHQMFDVSLAQGTGFKGVLDAFKGMIAGIGPVGIAIGVAVGAIALFTAAWQRAQTAIHDAENAMVPFTDQFQSSGQQIIDMAHSVADETTASFGDATKALQTFAQIPFVKLSGAQMVALTKQANDLAAAMGTTLPEAAKLLASAMQNPAKVAQEWADKGMFGMNQATALQIDLLSRAGNKTEAYNALMGTAKDRIKGVADNMSPLSKLFNDLGILWGKMLDELVREINTALDWMTRLGAKMAELITQARDYANQQATQGPNGPVMGGATGASPGTTGMLGTSGGGTVLTNVTNPNDLQFGTSYGIMQVTKGAAESVQMSVNNLKDALGNVTAGLSYIAQRTKELQLPLSESGVGAAYNPKGGTDYVTKLQDALQHIGELPADTAQLIKDQAYLVASQYGLNKTQAEILARLGQQVAYVESRGFQYGQGPGQANVPTGKTAAAPTAQPTVPAAPPEPERRDTIIGVSTQKEEQLRLIEQASQLVTSGTTPTLDYAKATANIELLKKGLTGLTETGQEGTLMWKAMKERLDEEIKAQHDAVGPAEEMVRTLREQNQQQQGVADSLANGRQAARDYNIQVQAQQMLVGKIVPGMSQYKSALAAVTTELQNQAAIKDTTMGRQAVLDQQDQLDLLAKQKSLIGANVEQQQIELAVLKQQQEIIKSRPNELEEVKEKELANAAALAKSTFELQQQQQALTELGNMFTQIADQIGNAITQAFVSGQGAAVNFGNVAKGIATSLIQEFAKLAIINPILNSITGQASTTLGSVLGAVGGLGTGGTPTASSSGGSGLSTLSNVASGFGLLDKLGFTNIGGQFSQFGAKIGLTGPNGLFGGTGNMFGNIGTSIGNFLDTPAFVPSFMPGLNTPAAAESMLGLPSAGSSLAPATFGTLIGGAAAGFTAGSLAGSFIQNSLGKTGPAPMIGAGVGAIGGAVLGSIIPGIGTLIGGIIGGLIGGGGGGLIGPKAPSPYAVGTYLVGAGGQLSMGAVASQKMEAGPMVAQLAQDINQINQILSGGGAKISDTAGQFFVGSDPKHAAIQTQSAITATLADAFKKFQFTSDDPTKASLLKGRTFGDLSQLNTVLGTFINFSNAMTTAGKGDLITKFVNQMSGLATADLPAQMDKIANFVIGTVPPLLALGTKAPVVGALPAQISALTASFDAAIATAKELNYAEADLTAARAKALQAAQDTAWATVVAVNKDLQFRQHAAEVTLGSFSSQTAALEQFDDKAKQQRDSFSQQLIDLYGDSFTSTKAYADEMALLEKTLGEERLATMKQFNDQAVQANTQVITSLQSYVLSLQVGQNTPFTPQQTYDLAKSQFQAVSGAAAAGDYKSLTQLQQFSDAFLNASRGMFGSGTGFVTDFQKVVDTLSTISQTSADALTASYFAEQTKQQTTAIVDALATLKDEITQVRLTLNSANGAPARIAA